MYAAVGNTRLLPDDARRAQWSRSVSGLKEAASYAAERSIKLAIEPLNRFETDLVNTVDQGIRMVDDIAVENVGLLLDTFHMNIEEKDIPAAIGRAAGRIIEFHACSNDRGTPGEDHLPWKAIAEALRGARYEGPIVIEAFTPGVREIARAVSIWRPLAKSQDAAERMDLAARAAEAHIVQRPHAREGLADVQHLEGERRAHHQKSPALPFRRPRYSAA